MARNVKGLNYVISANTTRLQTGLRKAQIQMNSFTRSAKKMLGPAALGGLAAGVTAGVVSGVASMVRGFAAFESQMLKVESVLGASKTQMKALENSALSLARTSVFTTKQVGELQFELAKLGFKSGEIVNATKGILDLAAATGEDLATSAEVAGKTLRAFSLDSKEMDRVVNVMAASFSSSALDLTKFAESMKFVAPTAKQAGLSIEEVTALLGILANQGIEGSMAGTSLRLILSKLAGSGENLIEVLKEMSKENISLADAQAEVGLRAQTTALILLDSIDSFDDLTESITGTDKAAEMAEVQLRGLSGEIQKLSSEWDSFSKKGKGATSVLQSFVGAARSALQVSELMAEATISEQARILQGDLTVVAKVMMRVNRNMMDVADTTDEVDTKWGDWRTTIDGLDSSMLSFNAQLEIMKRRTEAIMREAGADPRSKLFGGVDLRGYVPGKGTTIEERLSKMYEQRKLTQEQRDFMADSANRLTEITSELDIQIPKYKQIAKTEEEIAAAKQAQADAARKVAESDKMRMEISGRLADGLMTALMAEKDGRKDVMKAVLKYNALMIASDMTRLVIASALAALTGGATIGAGGLTKVSSIGVYPGVPTGGSKAGIGSIFDRVAKQRGIPGLAEGGLAYSPTLAMVGDNINAKADPEVIAPLSKLEKMFMGGNTIVFPNAIVGDEREAAHKIGKYLKEYGYI